MLGRVQLFRFFVVLVCIPVLAAGQNVSYPAGASDHELRAFYDDWKVTYLSNICGEGRVVVDLRADPNFNSDPEANLIVTVSEAHGYGMLILVMSADFDVDAHDLFDEMVSYYVDFTSSVSENLMAWRQEFVGEECRHGVQVGDENSATDGDMDIAYALLLAHANWGSEGQHDYLGLARAMLKDVADYEMMAGAQYLNIGDWISPYPGNYADLTRSSDFMTSHYPAFALATCDERWLQLRTATYELVAKIANLKTGLLPDFIEGMPDDPRVPTGRRLEADEDQHFFWNAARTPFRIALDYILNDNVLALEALAPFNDWIFAETGGDPALVSAGYSVNGDPLQKDGTSPLAFVSMMGVAAMLPSADPVWREALWTNILARPIEDEVYFGNTLKLLALLAATGHWKTPNIALGDCQALQ